MLPSRSGAQCTQCFGGAAGTIDPDQPRAWQGVCDVRSQTPHLPLTLADFDHSMSKAPAPKRSSASARLMAFHPRLTMCVGSDRANGYNRSRLTEFCKQAGHTVSNIDLENTEHHSPDGDLEIMLVEAGCSSHGPLDQPVWAPSSAHVSRLLLGELELEVVISGRRVVTVAIAEEIMTAWCTALVETGEEAQVIDLRRIPNPQSA